MLGIRLDTDFQGQVTNALSQGQRAQTQAGRHCGQLPRKLAQREAVRKSRAEAGSAWPDQANL